MSDSESSALSSVPSEDEPDLQLKKKDGILKFFSKAPKPGAPSKAPKSPPRPKREASPPHEFVLADNPDIAFIVMFRARFAEAFPKSLANFGPQELERDIVDTVPGEHAEAILCALLGLLLNRKQDVKAGHYNRALEEAVQTHKTQWAKNWESKNPLLRGATFTSMTPTERLTLLRTLTLWSLSSSDAIKGLIAASYKQNRHEDDLNQPRSVQPWGSDSDKRRYFLIEGLDDTHFRVYRESNYTGLKRTWWSVAGDIEELKTLAEKLDKEDGGQKARVLSGKMKAAVPRFEATEEKRKRREYRQARKEQFKRPEISSYMYEGRTRGKRMKYTYSDDEDRDGGYSDATSNRRSTRNTRGNTPADSLVAPTVTLSGRQVKSRQGGTYGEALLSGAQAPLVPTSMNGMSEDSEDEEPVRPRRAAVAKSVLKKPHIEGYNSVDEMDSDEDDASEQDYGDDEEEDDNIPLESDGDESVELSDDAMEDDLEPQKSLIVKLRVTSPPPAKKTIIKLNLSPNSKRTVDASGTTGEDGSPEGAQSSASLPASVPASVPVSAPAPAAQVELPTKPIDIPESIPPMSPLAFRGSPEKPQSLLPASIDVGYEQGQVS